mmetsp:Transcript_84410/g.176687  ORF Transcript_84410/g.176687 Transcript_84410/m.176687 type:complete len:511 (-) Transcript_84410:40-1572(-)
MVSGSAPGPANPLSSSYGSAQAHLPQAPEPLEKAPRLPYNESFAPCLAELLGTFVLVLTAGILKLSPGSSTWDPCALGLVSMVMIYATLPVSGGNLNPAISLSLGIVGCLRWKVVVRYAVVQFFGALAASLVLLLTFQQPAKIGPVQPFSWEYAVAAEVIYTFMLCFVVNNGAVSRRSAGASRDDPNQYYALSIGLVIIGGGYSISNISGAILNPAIAMGLSASTGFKWFLAWLLAEAVGAILASIIFRVLRPEEDSVMPESMLASNRNSRLHVRYVSELVGTFMLVLTIGLNIVMISPAIGFATAAAAVSMVYSLANISGAHLNPAVTLAVVLSGRDKCSPADGAGYIVCQVVGGALAGVLYAQFHAAGLHSGLTFTLKHGPGYGPNAAGVVELLFSFFLAYSVLACATTNLLHGGRDRQSFYKALVVGSCVGAGGTAASRISGGAMNPAISVGVTVANIAHSGWAQLPPPFAACGFFTLWELTGGLLAAVVFSFTHPDEYKKAPLLAK